MDILYGFLIGLAFPPLLVAVISAMVAVRSRLGLMVGVTSIIMLAGPVVWIMVFIEFGVAAGFAAFAGWVLGLGVAGLMTLLFIISRARRITARPPWTVSS